LCGGLAGRAEVPCADAEGVALDAAVEAVELQTAVGGEAALGADALAVVVEAEGGGAVGVEGAGLS